MASSDRLDPSVEESPAFRNLRLKSGKGTTLAGLGFSLRNYPAHTYIIQQGDSEDRTFIIHSGWGCLYRDLPNGERQIIDFTLCGDAIGPCFAKGEAQRSFISITDMLVFEAHPKTIASALTGSERLAELLLAAALRREGILEQHLTNLGRRSALVRTAHLLLELGARLEFVGCADSEGYDCPLTQYDLADALGLTAIHVNRMLRELRELGFLSLRKGRVEFLDLEGLSEFARFDSRYLIIESENNIRSKDI